MQLYIMKLKKYKMQYWMHRKRQNGLNCYYGEILYLSRNPFHEHGLIFKPNLDR